MRRAPGILFVLMAICVCLAPRAGRTQEAPVEPLPVESSGLLRSKVGAGRLVTLPTHVERVALADEATARVQIISEREVLLTGLQPGRTTLFVWLADGRRLRYLFHVEWDLELVQKVLRHLDPRITVETSVDGEAVVLLGEVADSEVARQAKQRAESLLLGAAKRVVRVVDLLNHPDPDFSPDDRLAAALREIDPRIRARRLQVGPDPQPEKDTYILEGRVRDVAALVRALTLAERQLGGTGVGVVPVEGRADLAFHRNRGFGGGFGRDDVGSGRHSDSLNNLSRAPGGLASEVSRGLVMMSQSGRVVSFLEVDELPQILVAIRVLEIDRAKARRAGINFRIDSEHYSIGSFTGPQTGDLPSLRGETPSISGITGGNLAVAFVDQMTSITAAIDFLEDQQVARAVAEPNVVTLTGEQASVVVGGEIPVPTTTVGEVAAVQGFFFQEFGVRLNIRPTVDSRGVITLEVSPSIIRPSVALGVSAVPGFTVQSVHTTARVHAGQSLVIGGLLDFEETLEERRLPVLGKIPIFRWRRRSRAENELLFVISPRLVDIEPIEAGEPIPPLDGERLELPELEWPEDRDDWRDEFDPRSLGPEGAPVDFLRQLDESAAPPMPPPVADPYEAAPEIEAPARVEVIGEPEPEAVLVEEPEERVPTLADQLVAGARLSVARSPGYDTAYYEMAYPGGDPGLDRGTDVDLIVRAFRHAGIDLQRWIHEDVVAHPDAYGIDVPDANIDHRRIRNLATFFSRQSFSLAPAPDGDWRGGDVVIWDLRADGSSLHVGIVSDERGPQIIHHKRMDETFSGFPSEDEVLDRWPVLHHFRWPGGEAPLAVD